MRRLTIGISAAFAIVFVVAVSGQEKLTFDEHATLMKANAQAMTAFNSAIESAAWPEARLQVATLRKSFMAMRPFWAERNVAAASGMVRTGLSQLAALEEMLGRAAAAVPQAALRDTAKELTGVCASCHAAYREGTAQSGFKFKAGVF